MTKPQAKIYSIPVPPELDAQVRADMASSGFDSLSEYVRDALRARLERSARRRLEANLAQAAERGDYGEARPEVWAWFRDFANVAGAGVERVPRRDDQRGASGRSPSEGPGERIERLLRALRDHEAELRGRGVVHAAVFGSTARGEATSEGDVDILVDIDPELRSFSIFDFVGLARHLRAIVPGADVVERKALKPRIRDRILAEAVDAF